MTAILIGYLTLPASKLSRLLFLSASKCKNIKNIPCPTFGDVRLTIRALTSLNISNSMILGAEAGRAFAVALASNAVLKQLDLSGGTDILGHAQANIDVDFAKEFAVGLGANRALTSLDLTSNSLDAKGAKHVAEAIQVNVSVLRFD